MSTDLLIPLVQKEKWPKVRMYMDSWAVAIGLTGCLGTWKENIWKIKNKKFLGGEARGWI